MAVHTHIMPGGCRALRAAGFASVRYASADRDQIKVATRPSANPPGPQDPEPQFIITPAGHAALEAGR